MFNNQLSGKRSPFANFCGASLSQPSTRGPALCPSLAADWLWTVGKHTYLQPTPHKGSATTLAAATIFWPSSSVQPAPRLIPGSPPARPPVKNSQEHPIRFSEGVPKIQLLGGSQRQERVPHVIRFQG